MIEVILAITVVGILAVVALPQFSTISEQADASAQVHTVSIVQTGIDLWHIQDIVDNGPPGLYPATLDALANGTQCGVGSTCFSTVLPNGIAEDQWTKLSGIQYQYTRPGGAQVTYTYSNVNGTFTQD